jgi:hypothetical protein
MRYDASAKSMLMLASAVTGGDVAWNFGEIDIWTGLASAPPGVAKPCGSHMQRLGNEVGTASRSTKGPDRSHQFTDSFARSRHPAQHLTDRDEMNAMYAIALAVCFSAYGWISILSRVTADLSHPWYLSRRGQPTNRSNYQAHSPPILAGESLAASFSEDQVVDRLCIVRASAFETQPPCSHIEVRHCADSCPI